MYGHIILSIDRALAVDGFADNIEHAAECSLADGHLDGRAGVNGTAATGNAVGGEQRNAANTVVAEVLDSLHDDLAIGKLNLYCVIYFRHSAGGKLYINDRADDPSDDTIFH